MEILLFDPRVMGHHVEFLEHAARYSIANGDVRVHMVVHPHIDQHAQNLVQLAEDHASSVILHPLTETEFAATERTDTIFERALAGWEAAEVRARRAEVDHCVFMEVNAYQPILGLPRVRQAPFQTSGILFFPYCRLETTGKGWYADARLRIERARKHLQLRWVLSNPNVHTLFLLNDPWAAQELSSALKSDAPAPLPDPVLPLPDAASAPSNVIDWANTHWSSDRIHFLLFGSLRETKGVRPALEAFQHLTNTEAEKASLHVLGRARDDLNADLPILIERLRRQKPGLHLHFENRYLSVSELGTALDRTDVVLAPYLRTEGSSGVLGHAASHKHPIIGPATGLIGQLIETYNLGTRLHKITPSALAHALRTHLKEPFHNASEAGMRRYVAERSPEAFARTLFQTLKGKQSPLHKPSG